MRLGCSSVRAAVLHLLCKKSGMAKCNFVLEEVVLLSDHFTQNVELANKSDHDWVCFYWIGTKAIRI